MGNLLGGVGNTSSQSAAELNAAQGISPVLNASLLAGLGGLASAGETYDPSYCSVKLPPPQPLAPPDSAVALRYYSIQLRLPHTSFFYSQIPVLILYLT